MAISNKKGQGLILSLAARSFFPDPFSADKLRRYFLPFISCAFICWNILSDALFK